MKMKRFSLVLLAMLLVLSVFTACDDDDDDDSRAYTDFEIFYAILDACTDTLNSMSWDASATETTPLIITYTFVSHSCTVTSILNGSDISVTINSGSTLEYAYSSTTSERVVTYDIDATVDGTSRSLYYEYTEDESDGNVTTSTIKLDGVELTGRSDATDDPTV